MLEKYKVMYTEEFEKDVRSVLSYITNRLKNKDAALSLLENIEKEINKRQKLPKAFKPYYINEIKKEPIYYIKIQNFYAFYEIKEKIMEFQTFIYSRLDVSKMLVEKRNKKN